MNSKSTSRHAARSVSRALVPILVAAGWLLGSFSLPAVGHAASRTVPGEILVAFEEELGALRRESILASISATPAYERASLGYWLVRVPSGASVDHAIDVLQRDRAVSWAEPNYYYEVFAPAPQDPFLVDLPATMNQWGIFETGTHGLWRYGGGGDPSLVISIVDSGIDDFATPHEDLAANALASGWDFVDGDADPTDAGVNRGHGTSVAGVAAAVPNDVGIAGVAHESKLQIVRVMDCNLPGCAGTTDHIAAGIAWAAANGAHVINLSLGGPDYSQAMRNAVLLAISQGAIVVAASGNAGASTLPYPADFPEVITVGATEPGGAVWSDSNYGDNLDLVAPGRDIWVPTIGGTNYAKKTGTSLAAPFVSGVVALLKGRNPSLTHLEAKVWLAKHTTPTSDPLRDGAGLFSYLVLSDASDSPFHAPASHTNFLWEWLGTDVTPEAGPADPDDFDGAPNIAGPFDPGHGDGGDDGPYPMSLGTMPYAPTRWALPKHVEIPVKVAGHLGPRYGAAAAKNVYVNQWIDWNSDGVFGMSSPEHTVVAHAEDPTTWPGDETVVTVPLPVSEQHILGNPLWIRTRVTYGASTTPTGAADFGEVEDHHMVNYVEDFDSEFYAPPGPPFVDLGTWFLVPDPQPVFANHGMWEMARAHHPPMGHECTGFVERREIMTSVPMDWSEYSAASVTFVYSHQSLPCGPIGIEECRVEGKVGGAVMFSAPIPLGFGTITMGLPMLTGFEDPVTLSWIVDTDNQGHMIIDDIRIVAFDDRLPAPISDLAVARTAGSNVITATWTATDENAAAPRPEATADSYQVRYSVAPIAGVPAFLEAQPVTTRDVPGGVLPLPGAPGSPQSVSFEVPSAFDDYHVAVVAADEFVFASSPSNVPVEGTNPTAGVAVTAPPGPVYAAPDSVEFAFTIHNTGNAEDLVIVAPSGIVQGWAAYVREGADARSDSIAVAIPPGANAALTCGVVIPPAAPDSTTETLRVTAISTNGAGVSAFGDLVVGALASATDAPAVASPVPATAGLAITGSNPFRSRSAVSLALTHEQSARLQIYDVAGRLVRTLHDATLEAGVHRIEWDGTNGEGRAVPSGIYFLKADAHEVHETARLVRMK